MLHHPMQATSPIHKPPTACFQPTRQFALQGLFVFLTILGFTACSAVPKHFNAETTPPAILLPIEKTGIVDGRGRFRELFCEIHKARGAQLPDDRPCDGNASLWRLAGEPAATGKPVSLEKSSTGLRVVMVPGLLAECVADKSKVFEDGVANLEAQGYKTGYIQTRGRQRCDRNADIIHEAILGMPEQEKIILVTHSKGTVDTLEALAKYPELTDRVLAVISVSGAVNGSPIADVVPESLVRLAEEVKLSSCPQGEGIEAVESLRRSVRLGWLATHALPKNVRFYSLAAFARPEDISAILKPFFGILSQTDPLNDSLVVCSDAIIPGSTLLGYPNADHLAVAMPFTAKNPLLSATLITRNRYPRAVLLEAAVRYAEEDLQNCGVLRPQEAPLP
jgi:hypothetical protein